MHSNSKIHYFSIAEFGIKITFNKKTINSYSLLESFKSFKSNIDNSNNLLFELNVDDTIKPFPKETRERITTCNTGNGNIIVDKIIDYGYQFIIKDYNGLDCCLLQTNADFSKCQCALNGNLLMRKYGLNNAIILSFTFSSCKYNTLLIHASLVRQGEYGYAFIGKSGTGKSTQTSMWLQHLPNCDLMNDDNPIIRIINKNVYIYGSPWSGKTPCYRNTKALLGAVTRINRASFNSIEELSPIYAYASILPACSSMKWDKITYDHINSTIARLIELRKSYILHCLPNKEAAEICNKRIKSDIENYCHP